MQKPGQNRVNKKEEERDSTNKKDNNNCSSTNLISRRPLYPAQLRPSFLDEGASRIKSIFYSLHERRHSAFAIAY